MPRWRWKRRIFCRLRIEVGGALGRETNRPRHWSFRSTRVFSFDLLIIGGGLVDLLFGDWVSFRLRRDLGPVWKAIYLLGIRHTVDLWSVIYKSVYTNPNLTSEPYVSNLTLWWRQLSAILNDGRRSMSENYWKSLSWICEITRLERYVPELGLKLSWLHCPEFRSSVVYQSCRVPRLTHGGLVLPVEPFLRIEGHRTRSWY